METLTLMPREEKRLRLLNEVEAGRRTVGAAAVELEVTERHAYRLLSQFRAHGVRGLLHGNRGSVPANKIPERLISQILALRKGEYAGFNDRHFQQELADEKGISVGRESVRKILRENHIEAKHQKRRREHRRRREPKERFGEMLQGDASPHDWLEGRGPLLALTHFVDDATGVEWAEFFEKETTEGYLTVMGGIIENQGIPMSLYVDKHSAFRVNRDQTFEEQLTGKRPLTTFGRAMEELGIRVIFADSAPAKGRVERKGGLNQDRLVSELRRANACTIEEARQILKQHLLKNNKRFYRAPKSAASAFGPRLSKSVLKQILCWKEERVVGNDNTISFQGKHIQIMPNTLRSSWAKCRVAVHYCLDGSLYIFHQGERIAYMKDVNVRWADLPESPEITGTLKRHSPNLTFSLGQNMTF